MKPLVLLSLLFFLLQQSLVAQYSISGDTTQPRLIWQHPAPAVATSALLLAGVSPYFFEAAVAQNQLVREEVQMWRRDKYDFASFEIENIFQYLPLASVELLDWFGVPSRHKGWPLLYRTASSFLITSVVTQSLKHSVNEWRPDHSATNSFPSGHTALAAAGAELLRLEYGKTSAWIPAAGFTVAAATGFMRIYNDRHWLNDVLAGAAIGIISADISYWFNAKLETLFEQKK